MKASLSINLATRLLSSSRLLSGGPQIPLELVCINAARCKLDLASHGRRICGLLDRLSSETDEFFSALCKLFPQIFIVVLKFRHLANVLPERW